MGVFSWIVCSLIMARHIEERNHDMTLVFEQSWTRNSDLCNLICLNGRKSKGGRKLSCYLEFCAHQRQHKRDIDHSVKISLEVSRSCMFTPYQRHSFSFKNRQFKDWTERGHLTTLCMGGGGGIISGMLYHSNLSPFFSFDSTTLVFFSWHL